jgi:hypothetical protein
MSTRLLPLALAIAALFLPGCRRAAVDARPAVIQTSIAVGEPSYVTRAPQTAQPDAAPQPGRWYSDLQVVVEQDPQQPLDARTLEGRVNEGKPAVSLAAEALLKEVQRAVEAKRHPSDKWSLIALSLGRGKYATGIIFTADVGLTRLFAKRPAVAFTALPLELCVAKLCRDSEILPAQSRGYSPFVTWSKSDVSTYEALEGILSQHGFSRQYADTNHRVTLPVTKFPDQAAFLDAAVAAILEKGKTLNHGQPVITVRPKETPPPPETSDDKEPETPAKPDAKAAPPNPPAT